MFSSNTLRKEFSIINILLITNVYLLRETRHSFLISRKIFYVVYVKKWCFLIYINILKLQYNLCFQLFTCGISLFGCGEQPQPHEKRRHKLTFLKINILDIFFYQISSIRDTVQLHIKTIQFLSALIQKTHRFLKSAEMATIITPESCCDECLV